MARGGGADVLVKIGGDVTEFQNSLGGLLSDVQSSVAKMNPIVALASAAVLGIGTSAAKVALEFDDALDTIQAKTGATTTEMDGLGASFRSVFGNVLQDAPEVAEAIAALNQRLELTGPALEGAATGFLNLSRLLGEDTAGLITATTQAMNAWGVAAGDVGDVQDKLLIISQNTGASITELAAGITAAQPVLSQWGLSWEESATLMGKFEEAGVPAGDVVNGLKRGLKEMTDEGTTPSKEAFLELIDGIESGTISTDLFGKAGVALGQIIRDGKIDIDSFAEALANSEGALAGTILATDGLTESWGKLWHRIQELIEPLGKLLLMIGETLVKSFESAIAGAGHLATIFKKLIDLDFKGIGEYKKQVDDAKAASEAAELKAKAYAETLAEQNTTTKALTKSHKDHKTELDKLPSAFRLSTAEAKKLKDEQKELEKQHDKTEAATAKFKRAVEKIEAESAAKNAAFFLKIEHENLERQLKNTEQGLKDFNAELLDSIRASDDFTRSLPQIGSALDKIVPILTDVELAAFDAETAMKAMGITPKAELDALARNAEDNFLKIKNGGIATPQEIDKAWVLMETARKTALQAAGTDLPLEEQKVLDAILAKQKTHKTDSEGVFSDWATSVKGITGTLGTDSLKALFSGDGFGGITDKLTAIKDSFQDMFITKIGGILDTFITNNLGKLMGKFDDLLAKIPGLGKLGDIFGTGASAATGAAGQAAGAATSAAGTAASTAASAGGSAASTATGVASTALSTTLSAITAVSGVVSAVSGVLGLFGIGEEGQKDRLNIIANNTSYDAWRGSVGGEHEAVLDTRNVLNVIFPTLMEARDDIKAIRWPVEQMRDFTLNSLPLWLDRIVQMVPTVNVRVELDGAAIAANVETRIEYGTRLATS